jgi:hypothetical protein
MTKATDIQAIDTLLSTPAANADQLGAWQAQDDGAIDTGSDSTGAWDAFDVWRRLIKEPRDRRRPQPG